MYRIQSIRRIPGVSGHLGKSHSTPVAARVVYRPYSEHSEDTLHVPKQNKGRQVSSVPPIMQGVQPMSREMSPNDTKEILVQAQAFLKNQQDRSELLRNKMQNVNQGAACREFHTSTRASLPTKTPYSSSSWQLQMNVDTSKAAFGTAATGQKNVHTGATVCGTADTWDEDMACVLQGSCLPGSTKYCPTKSVLGKVTLSDVLQGSRNGQLLAKVRSYSTISAPHFTPVRHLHNRPSHFVGRTYEAWDEDVVLFFNSNKNQVHEFNEIPNIDRATRLHYHTDPRSQFVPRKEGEPKFGETKRSYHTGDISPLSERLGRNFETWDEDVAHMLHNLPSKPVFGRPRKDIRPASSPPVKYVPWY